MFYDPTIVGSWPALAARLDDNAALARWAEAEPPLAGFTTVAELLAVWSEDCGSVCTDVVLAALVRLAAVDGGRDDDALLLTLHLLSGLVWTTAAQLRDLSPDIVAVVVGELACQIRRYPWRRRPRAIAANLRAETRRGVLTELRPRCRRHPDRGEVLTIDGDVTRLLARRAVEGPRTSMSSTCSSGRCARASTQPTSRCWSRRKHTVTADEAVTRRWPRRTASRPARCIAGGPAR